jgi:hypothetical protein
MIEVKVKITGKSPLSQSRPYQFDVKKIGQEKPDDYEKRTWRNRLNVENGSVYIPCVSIPTMLLSAAKRYGLKYKGNSTYSSRFKGGVLCMENISLNIPPEQAEGQWLFVPADGVTGSGKRVMKCFPKIDTWSGTATIVVLDDTITKEVFDAHMKYAGSFIGLGRFRPQNGGFYGRFSADIISWTEKTDF